MKRLILLRHAKSSWTDSSLDDHARPLSPRGVRAAPAMARWLADEGWVPDRVLSSDATRTRQTWDLVSETWAARSIPLPEVGFRPGLYLASPRRILGVLAQEGGDATTVLVVGHNPGLHDLARTLMVPGSAKSQERLDRKFPTGAAAILEFSADRWNHLAVSEGRLVAFMRPKDLPEAKGHGL